MSRAVPVEEKPYPARLMDGTEVLIVEGARWVAGDPPVMRGDGRGGVRRAPIPGAVAKVKNAGSTHASVIDYVSTRVEPEHKAKKSK